MYFRLLIRTTIIWMLVAIMTSTIQTAAFAQEKEAYTVDEALDDLKAWYKNAKESGVGASTEIYNWLKESLTSLNTWEYHIISVPTSEMHLIKQKMNELGQDRWECIQVVQQEEKMVLFFKRPLNYSLSSLPVRELLKILSITRGLSSE